MGEDFQRIDDPRAAAIEISVAVQNECPTGGDSRQLAVARKFLKSLRFLHGAFQPKAARGDNKHLGTSGNDFWPADVRAVLANTPKQRLTAGGLHKLRRPIASAHQRLGPFE